MWNGNIPHSGNSKPIYFKPRILSTSSYSSLIWVYKAAIVGLNATDIPSDYKAASQYYNCADFTFRVFAKSSADIPMNSIGAGFSPTS